ncbi:MAG: hypothetical protein JSS91_01525 [Bacteroidetes bacterium]|nr:hypothetical protein [Bacteroidota bacterium]
MIHKTLSSKGYDVSVSDGMYLSEKIIKELSDKIECFIIDSGIEEDLLIKLKMRFRNSSYICLPSLNKDCSNNNGGTKNISEPLKLSELFQTLDSIFKIKDIEK